MFWQGFAFGMGVCSAIWVIGGLILRRYLRCAEERAIGRIFGWR
jgi:hypothetical protein